MTLHRLFEAEILLPASGLSRRTLRATLPSDPATGRVPTLAVLRWEGEGIEALFSVEGAHVARGSAGSVVVRVEPRMTLVLRATGAPGAALRLWLEHDAAGPPLVRVVAPGFEERLGANLLNLVLELDRAGATLSLDGRAGFCGGAWTDGRYSAGLDALPLRAEAGLIEGELVARDGSRAAVRIPYRLAEGVRPRALVLDPHPDRLSGKRGESLRFGGEGLERAWLTMPTERGPIRQSLRPTDDGAFTARIPDDAVHGTALLARGRDAYVLPFDLVIPARLHKRRALTLGEALDPTGRPGQSGGLVYLVRWPRSMTVGALNDLLIASDARLLGSSPVGETTAQTWIEVPLARQDRFEAAVAAQPGAASFADRGLALDQLLLANPQPRWRWGELGAGQVIRGRRPSANFIEPVSGGQDYVSPTWFLEFSRAPAIWNLKAKATNAVEVLVVDVSVVGQQADLAFTGGFPVPVLDPSAKPINHGVEVASVIGARHDPPGAQVSMEGINPLVGHSEAGVPKTSLVGAGVAQCTAEKIVPTTIEDWNHVAKSIGAQTRVLNCSFGLDPAQTGNAVMGYINVPLLIRSASPALQAIVAKALFTRILILVGVAQGRTPDKQGSFEPISKANKANQDINLAEVKLREALAALKAPVTEDDILDLMGKAVTDANLRPVGMPKPDYRKLFEPMRDTIVLDPKGVVPKMPEETAWIPIFLESVLPPFLSSDTGKKLETGTFLLVTGAGNDGTLSPPGEIMDANVVRWVGWQPGKRPKAQAFSRFGHLRHTRAADWQDRILIASGFQPDKQGPELWDEPTETYGDVGRGRGTVAGEKGEVIYAGAARVGALAGGSAIISAYGTSYAAPAVAGLASYLFALDPGRPSTVEDQKAQVGRLIRAVYGGARSTAGVDGLDCYATARLFLSGVGLAAPSPAYDRAFDRMMCDCDDGTPHGNLTPAAGGPGNSGSSPEWLKGDGKVNMADFRAFRDAWLQTHLFYPEPGKRLSVLEDRGDHAFRFRDLGCSGLKPWEAGFNDDGAFRTSERRSIRVWSRFDFDGSGLLEREQLCDAATLALCRGIGQGKLLPDVQGDKGYDLALLASLWPDTPAPWPADGALAPGQSAKSFPEDYEFITDPTQLLSLLPSCDLSLNKAGLEALFAAAAQASEGAKTLKSIEFVVERGKFNGAKFTPEGGVSHSRIVPEDRLPTWKTAVEGGKAFWLTVPLVPVAASADLAALDPTKAGFLGECLRVSARVEITDGKKPGTYTLKAKANSTVAAMANGAAQADCITARLGGRYPIEGFTYEDPNQSAQPKVASGVRPVPGDKMVATIGTPLCIDCQASTLTLPTRPQGSATAPVRPGRPGPINPFGGGGGGGFQSGVGGFPGWNQAAGGAVASFTAMGPALCYANILSALQYKDSDFEVTATVVPPPGTTIAAASAGMRAGPGLSVQGGGPLVFGEEDEAVPGVARPDAEGLRFSWTLRGDEGRRRYTISVQGTLGSDAGSAPFGPVELEGELEIVQPFFLVALSFPATAVQSGERFDMIATIANSADVTGTAFDVEMSVTATNATPIDPRRELGDLGPGDAVTTSFGFLSALTGPIVGASTSTMGRVSAEVTVGGIEASPPSYPIEITAGLNALLARYPELTLAIMAYAGAVFAQGILRQDRREIEAAAAIGYALHRAGYRLLDGEPDVDVIAALVLDAQGGATDNAAADALRRETPVGRKVATAAGPALVRAAERSGVNPDDGLFDRLCDAPGGEPLLAARVARACPLVLEDAQGRSVGDGEKSTLPFAADYAPSPGRLLVANLPEGAYTLRVGPGAGLLELSIPTPEGARRARWTLEGAATVRIEAGEATLLGEAGAIAPERTISVSDPPPRVVSVSVIPATPYVSPYRNVEVRFSEAVDIPSVMDARHFEVPGYGVERVSWYAPTRAAILFLDNPVLEGATLSVRDVVDPLGQPVAPNGGLIRGAAPAGAVVGIARDPRGAPIPGARLAAFGDAGYRETFADEAGAFTLAPLPLGSFTLEVYDPRTDRYGTSARELVEPGQRLGVDPRVEPDGTVSGRVRGPDGAPLAGAIVNLLARWPYESGQRTDEEGLYRFTNVPLGSFFLGVLGGELSAGAQGALVEVDQALVLDVQLRPRALREGTLRGVVLAPDGQPAVGAVVRVRGDGAAQVTPGADGAFSVGPLPGGHLRVEARDRFDRVVETELELDGDRRVELRLPALGGLRVDVFDTVGMPLPGATVYLNSMEGPRRVTDASGAALFPTLPAGPARVIATLGNRLGAEPVTVREGKVDELLVRLFPEAFLLPAGLTDSNGVRWSVGERAELRRVGNGFAYPGEGLAWRVAGERFVGGGEATTITPGLELALEQELGRLRLRRRVYCSPSDGWFLRVIDSVTNRGEAAMRVPVSWTAGRFDADPTEPRPGVVLAGDSAWVRGPFGEPGVLPVRGEGGGATLETEVSLEPGQTLAFLHFLVTRPADRLVAAAEGLVRPPAQALVGLDAAAAAQLVNAALPEARGGRSPRPRELEPADATLTVRTADGAVVGGARVLVEVHSPYHDRRGELRAGPEGIVPIRGLVAGELRARASHPETGAADEADFVLVGGETLVADLPLRQTATVTGRVLRADGTPPGLCDVDVQGAVTGVAVDGRFVQRGVPVRALFVTARDRQFRLGRRVPLSVREAGTVVDVEIRLPAVGFVSGRVLRGDGLTPAGGLTVSLRSADPDNGEGRVALTGVDGRFDFALVPAGPFSVYVQSGDAVASQEGVVPGDGARVELALTLGAVGVVKGRALSAEGGVLVDARVEIQHSRGARTVRTDTFGAYVVVGVGAGPVRVRVVPADGVGEGVAELQLTTEGQRLIADVVVDREPPSLRILAPVGRFEALSVPIEVRAEDAGRGLDPTALHVLLNGREITGALAAADGARSGTIPVGDALRLGDNVLRAFVQDRAGNRAEAEQSFRVAAGALTLALTADGAPLTGVQVVLTDRMGERILRLDDGARLTLPTGTVRLELDHAQQTVAHRYATATAEIVDGESVTLAPTFLRVGGLGVRVYARDGRSFAAGARVELSRDGQSTVYTADDFGGVDLRRQPIGPVRITASFQGDTVSQDAEIPGGEVAYYELFPAGLSVIEGVVRDPVGPVNGALVQLLVAGGPERSQVAVGGRFRFDGLRPGLSATVFGSAPGRTGNRAFFTLPPPTVTSVDLALAYVARAIVRGVVYRFDGLLAANASVRIGNEAEVRTDEAGRFEVGPIRVGTFALTARSAEGDLLTQGLSIGADTEAVELRLQLPGRGAVRLTVLRGAERLAGVEVNLRAFYGQTPVSTRTDADGMVELGGLVAGAADLLLRDPESTALQFLYIPVNPGQTTAYVHRFPVFASFQGRVLRDDGQSPAPGFQVRATGAVNFSVVTDAEGRYALPEVFVGEGSYTIEAFTTTGGYFDIRARAERTAPGRHREVVEETLTLSPRGTVSGVLRGPDGPVAGQPVELFGRGEVYFAQTRSTDAAGRYRFEDVPLADFLLRSSAEATMLLGQVSGGFADGARESVLDLSLLRALRVPRSVSIGGGRRGFLRDNGDIYGQCTLLLRRGDEVFEPRASRDYGLVEEAGLALALAGPDGEEITRTILADESVYFVRRLERLRPSSDVVLLRQFSAFEPGSARMVDAGPGWAIFKPLYPDFPDDHTVLVWGDEGARSVLEPDADGYPTLREPLVAGVEVERLSFVATVRGLAGAREARARLQGGAPEAVRGLEGREIAGDWSGPLVARLPALSARSARTLRFRLVASDGQTPLRNGQLEITPQDPFFGQRSFYYINGDRLTVSDLVLGEQPLALRVTCYPDGGSVQTTRELPGPTDEEILLRLDDAVLVRGQVVDGQGAPVPGASVRRGFGVVSADAQGRFVLGPLRTGVVLVESGGASAFVDALPGAELRLVLPDRVEARATVLARDGRPAAGVYVYTLNGNAVLSSGYTDALGQVRIAAQLAEGLRVFVRDPVTQQAVVGPNGATLTLPGRAALSGSLADPVAGLLPFRSVRIQPLGVRPLALAPDGVAPYDLTRYANTDGAGRFSFPDAPVGPVELVAQDYDGRELRRALELAGTVDVALVFPEPVVETPREVVLTVRNLGGDSFQVRGPDGSLTPLDEDGRCRLALRGEPTRVLVESTTDNLLAQPVWLRGDAEVALPPRASLSGIVLDAAGLPQAYVSLHIYTPAGAYSYRTNTDQDGRFRFERLFATEAQLEVRGRRTEQPGAPLRLVEGENEVVLRLPAPGTVVVKGAEDSALTLYSGAEDGDRGGIYGGEARYTDRRALPVAITPQHGATIVTGVLEEGAELELTLPAEQVGLVFGRLLVNGVPWGSARVRLDGAIGREVRANDRGDFLFEGMQPGPYVLRAISDEGQTLALRLLELGDGGRARVDLQVGVLEAPDLPDNNANVNFS